MNEFNAKFGDKTDDLNNEEGLFDLEGAPSDMPSDWVKISAYFIIPKIILNLKGVQDNDDLAFVKLESSGIEFSANAGNEFQRANIKLGSLDIVDLLHTNSRYSHMTHTKMNKGMVEKGAIEITFDRNNRRYANPIKIKLETKSQQYVVGNFLLIHAVQQFIKGGVEDDDINLDYYKKLAQDRTLELMEQGREYVDKVSEDAKTIYEAIDLEVDFSTPIIVIPELIRNDDKDKEAMIFNIGKLTARTKLTKYDKYK
jgi:hypothetical protein